MTCHGVLLRDTDGRLSPVAHASAALQRAASAFVPAAGSTGDWAQVNGIDVLTAQTGIAEAGAELSAFPGEKQFTSWLGLCPTNEQSGGKILNRRTRKVASRAATAFRNAASTLIRSQSYLGAQYRRLRTRLGAPKAITAMARKLACLFLQADQTRAAVRGQRDGILRSPIS